MLEYEYWAKETFVKNVKNVTLPFCFLIFYRMACNTEQILMKLWQYLVYDIIVT